MDVKTDGYLEYRAASPLKIKKYVKSFENCILPDGECLVPEESILQVNKICHGGIIVDQFCLVKVHLDVHDSVDGYNHVA